YYCELREGDVQRAQGDQRGTGARARRRAARGDRVMQALVQLRGEVNMEGGVRDTLSMLNVHSTNHCALVPETDTYEGMITKVNDYVAFGEPSPGVLATLLQTRGEPAEG